MGGEKAMNRLTMKIIPVVILSLAVAIVWVAGWFSSRPVEASESTSRGAKTVVQSELPANFNHDSTTFPLLGAHRTLKCSECHFGGQYKRAPTACENCHNDQIGYGKPNTHIMTNQPCAFCHNVTAWSPASFKHNPAEVIGRCSTCHNGQKATGKPVNHITTTAQCDTCHKTTGWIPVTYLHDASAVGQCSTCHNGQKATGKPGNHIATTAQCDTCHKTTGWIPATFTHDASAVGQCSTCHNGQKATGMPATHSGVTLQCDTCHKTTGWIPANFASHDNPKLIGAHTPLQCSVCHPQNYSNPYYRDGTQYGFCANCHTRDYRPGAEDHRTLALDAMCANCHRHSSYNQF
jgi:hypothetical protein